MSDREFAKALKVGLILSFFVMMGMNLFGCSTTDGWHQDEIDWIIQNG